MLPWCSHPCFPYSFSSLPTHSSSLVLAIYIYMCVCVCKLHLYACMYLSMFLGVMYLSGTGEKVLRYLKMPLLPLVWLSLFQQIKLECDGHWPWLTRYSCKLHVCSYFKYIMCHCPASGIVHTHTHQVPFEPSLKPASLLANLKRRRPYFFSRKPSDTVLYSNIQLTYRIHLTSARIGG